MMAMLRVFVLASGLSLIASTAGWADQQTVRLARGAGSSLMLGSSFELVLIDNPDVVEVHSQSDRSVLIEGLALGVSNVVFIDAGNVAVANIRVLVCETVAVRTASQEKAGCD
jgi:Flp pilus assembly secretin CpaC